MDNYVISDNIYKESIEGLTDNRYVISSDIFEETASLTSEIISQELIESFHFSGRYWIWKMTSDYKKMEWKNRGCHLNCVTATYNKMYLEIVFIIKVE